MRIKMPNWVYKNLDTYGNCALPDICCEMNRASLKQHLSNYVKGTVKIREATFEKYGKEMNSISAIATYLIAEVVR